VSLVASARDFDPLVRTSTRIVRPVVGNLVASFSVRWCPHGICKQSSAEEDFGAVVAVLLLVGPDRVGFRGMTCQVDFPCIVSISGSRGGAKYVPGISSSNVMLKMEGTNALWPCINEAAVPGVAVLHVDVKWPAEYKFSGIPSNDIPEAGAFHTNLVAYWYGMLYGGNSSQEYVTPQSFSADAGCIQFLGYCREGSVYEELSSGCRVCDKYSPFDDYYCVGYAHGVRVAPALGPGGSEIHPWTVSPKMLSSCACIAGRQQCSVLDTPASDCFHTTNFSDMSFARCAARPCTNLPLEMCLVCPAPLTSQIRFPFHQESLVHAPLGKS